MNNEAVETARMPPAMANKGGMGGFFGDEVIVLLYRKPIDHKKREISGHKLPGEVS
jgi:hypothetical protein